jgi:oligopeptide transport system substrate-binding protein
MKNLSFILVFLFILSSCGENITPVDSGLEAQILHFGNGSEPQGLDPHIVTGVPEHHLINLYVRRSHYCQP